MSIRHVRRPYRNPRVRLVRPKTFKTEESAKAYAEKQGIKSYDIVNIKNDEANTKKLKVVPK
ncbi:hypothetical protein ACFL1H_01815 [Nanoarchaeota archaeon]